ncbi:MAG: S-adenosylmethionine:tRNA ribosyltransferase-isomerase [Candidatus Omnitrophica bacterium ADurb.Bin277]|nr:MAG: S-adenosylmethionine:tRNA ribosyltransferase-isomerase [Candidatus Omnitrophica bacterium ADurb.Bin277]
MRLSDFDYHLPKDKIALFPVNERADAKLLCVDRGTGAISHRVFRDLPDILRPTDLLVLNNTKVLPARLFGKRPTGGKVEALLLKEFDANVWECLLKPGGRVREGQTVDFTANGIEFSAEVINKPVPDSGQRFVRFLGDGVKEKIKMLGHIPLPPYIDRPDQAIDRNMYQTVFAEKEGAVASPTAGLHFDEALLAKVRAKGVEVVPVTLHVSYGTFQPIAVENIEDHKMFEEEYEITEDAAARINKAKREGRRVVVCGTTCVRALESAVNSTPSTPGVGAGRARTSIFIHPPYEFRIVDALITNFHMPKSTLLVMLAAFLDYNKMMTAYKAALENDYRFASYGDAMFIA